MGEQNCKFTLIRSFGTSYCYKGDKLFFNKSENESVNIENKFFIYFVIAYKLNSASHHCNYL